MDIGGAIGLMVAGLLGGTLNAVAGGGSLVTFPALIALGLPPVAANMTNSVALTPGYVASVAGSRAELATVARDQGAGTIAALLPPSLAGGVLGCVALLTTPATAFGWVAAILVAGATTVLAFQQRLRGLVGQDRDLTPRQRNLALWAVVFVTSIYSGYFGAASGLMLVAGMGLVLSETLAHINARKNVISATVALLTVVVFALFGTVDWVAAAIVAPASLIGGYVGARQASRLPSVVLRTVIVTIGTVVSVILFARALDG
jgi:uncharacterized membrane protein YfcA